MQKGKRVRTHSLDVRALASPLSHPRVGLVVPKLRQTVVKRNQLKRRLRELVRANVLPAAGSVDVVIRARSEAYGVAFGDLQRELAEAMSQLDQRFRV